MSRLISSILRRCYATESAQAVVSIRDSDYHAGTKNQSFQFTKFGFEAESVQSLLDANPELNKFPVDTLEQSIDLFRNQGFSTESYLRIIDKHPRILTTPAKQLCNNLELWRASQFGERYVQILITEHPHLLDIKVENKYAEQKILERLMYLKDYVQTKKNVWRLMVSSPNVVVDKLSDVEEKRTFFEDVMKVEHTEVVKTMAFSHSIFKIKMRHEFLNRLGMYKPKPEKADPTLKNSNPSLYQILDTTDKRFAIKVALVSLEEFEVFQDIYKREQERKAGRRAYDMDDDDDDDVGDDYEEEQDNVK